ncbi:MAG: hypothetical protein CFE23_14800 [Flavobacterium sp. BFFFF1]|nr:MAG: hypothetical protein CFE23_14800 [Flavobacterium sp. BFFFF1]
MNKISLQDCRVFPVDGPKLKRIFETAKPATAIFRVLPFVSAYYRKRKQKGKNYRFLPLFTAHFE